MKLNVLKKIGLSAFLGLSLVALTACGSGTSKEAAGTTAEGLTGEVHIDGSSTVYPITEAVAEEFLITNPDVRVPIGVSGTGGGFKKFIAKEIDINDASRKIKDKEAAEAKAAGVEYTEFEIAYDGLSILVNPKNDWVTSLTVAELKKIWEPNSTVKTWKDVRPEWPAETIKLYAPGTDSGTFDYFTETINGESGAIRQDFTASEDDNILVQGIAGDKNSIGFFGFAYYEENKDKLKLVKIDNGNGPIEPTFDTIKDGTYAPLSRALYLYVNNASLEKPEVKAFVKFYIENASEMAPAVGYISLPEELYTKDLEKLQ
jgi:phosphate transport system substrate-binding protein